MSILTGKPASLAKGTISSPITLSKADLATSLNITDTFWGDTANWEAVEFQFHDQTGNQTQWLVFSGANAGKIALGSSARANNWACAKLIIKDFDGGELVFHRSDFANASEFDFTVTA